MNPFFAFLLHLRPHYQIFILSGGYLLGGLYVVTPQWSTFLTQFLVVHLLLNGGVTAYNSWWDQDQGPIGGLEKPPPMQPWMHPASLALQGVGLALAWPQGLGYSSLYLLTMILSVFYSARYRFCRWKGRPWLSMVAVGIGTGTNTFLMGYLAAGGALRPRMAIAALGVAALLLSLYPVSQIFQVSEDTKNGDLTFAARYGVAGVRRWFVVTYPLGLLITSLTLMAVRTQLSLIFAAVGLLGGLASGLQLRGLVGEVREYRAVMRLKYGASLGFVVFLAFSLAFLIET